MAAQSGNDFLLKQGGTALTGLRATSFVLNNAAVDITSKDSSHWRTLLGAGGVRSLSITASGVFDDSAILETVRGLAFANSLNTFTMTFGNSDSISGSFLITSFSRSAANDDAEVYELTLESSGTVTYTP
jgi:TP901-1 family phage major tail protein